MKFYDTSSLLLLKDIREEIAISSISLKELENIKTSSNKDYDIKAAARRALRLIDDRTDLVEIIVFKNNYLSPLEEANFLINDDARILACAISQKNQISTFVSNDRCLRKIAQVYFPVVEEVKFESDNYTGYIEVQLSDEQLADLYQNRTINTYDLYINQYLNIYDLQNNLVDTLKWTGEEYSSLAFHTFESKLFGSIKPLDSYQRMAADSLCHNQLTLIGGLPGSGKTFLSLGYLFNQLDKGKIDRIIIFVNPVAARDTCRLGFYPGTMLEKVLSTQAGHTLSSKVGGMEEVERLIADGTLEIIPAVDARGYEVPPHSGVYMLEAQNLTSDTLRMLIQRCAEDTKIIIDGDRLEQIDVDAAKQDNGMAKASRVFRGSDLFGQVDLKTIRRSKIAQLAESLKE